MHSFEVSGGKKLSGDIIPQGAKNEALQIISAVLLTPEKVTISNIPDILDVNLLIELLIEMNVKVERPHRRRTTTTPSRSTRWVPNRHRATTADGRSGRAAWPV